MPFKIPFDGGLYHVSGNICKAYNISLVFPIHVSDVFCKIAPILAFGWVGLFVLTKYKFCTEQLHQWIKTNDKI